MKWGPVRQCLSSCARQFATSFCVLPDSGCFWVFDRCAGSPKASCGRKSSRLDENHVFPEDIIFEETELLAAMHSTVAVPTAADWIDFFFRRREVMTGPHSTRFHLYAGEMAKHFSETILFDLTLS